MNTPVTKPPPAFPPGMLYHWIEGLRYWVVVAAWMAFISALSTDPFSAQNTHRYIDPVLRWLFPELTPRGFVLAHTVIRKTAHFVEFFVLGLLIYWASRRGRAPRWRWSWSLQAVALSGAWALLDELHQAFVLTRTASLWDSGLDTLGAAASQVFIYLRSQLWRAKPRVPQTAPFDSPRSCD